MIHNKMNYTRKLLVAAVLIVGLTGLAFVSIPFMGSLNPSALAKTRLEAWKEPPLPDLNPGQVVIRQNFRSYRRDYPNGGWSPIWGQRDLLIRDHDGDFHSFRLPTWNGAVILPRVFWGQWEAECQDFGPVIQEGILSEETTIQCNDSVPEPWGPFDAKWLIDGTSLTKPYPDLPLLRCRKRDSGVLECV